MGRFLDQAAWKPQPDREKTQESAIACVDGQMDFPVSEAVVGLVSGAVVAAGTLLATHRRSSSEAHQKLLDAATPILGKTHSLLDALEPTRLAINANDRTLEALKNLTKQWQTVRGDLISIGARSPSDRLDKACKTLSVAVANALHQSSWLITDLLRGASKREQHDIALDHWKVAMGAYEEVRKELHARSRVGRWVRSRSSRWLLCWIEWLKARHPMSAG
jgi:hypothetical protein